MKIGLFFGSFNPIHTGHMIISSVLLANSDLDEVWFVVSPQNPFKGKGSLLHEQDRYDLVQAAVGEASKMRVIDIEFRMPRPSYTIDTLTYLAEQHQEKEFVLIIGEDNLNSFPKWKNHEQILDHFGLYVYPRPNSKPSKVGDHANVKFLDAPQIDISATFIRKSIKKGRSIKYLVPDPVDSLIRFKKFYQ